MLKERLKELPEVVSGIIYLIIGIICIIFHSQLAPAIPYIFGSLLVVTGLLRLTKYFANQDYRNGDCTQIVFAGIFLAIGLVFLCYPERGLDIFALFWGIFAIVSGIQCLHRLLYYAVRKQKWVIYLIEGVIEFSLGIMLLIEFSEGISSHLIILGCYLILVGLFGLFGIRLEKQGEKPIENEKGNTVTEFLSNFDDIEDFIPSKKDFVELKEARQKRKKSKTTQSNDENLNKNNENTENTENSEQNTVQKIEKKPTKNGKKEQIITDIDNIANE